MQLHPKSVVSKSNIIPSLWVVYHQKVKSSAVYLHDATSKLAAQQWGENSGLDFGG